MSAEFVILPTRIVRENYAPDVNAAAYGVDQNIFDVAVVCGQHKGISGDEMAENGDVAMAGGLFDQILSWVLNCVRTGNVN